MAKQVSLQILRILEENTDREHMLSKEDILQELGNIYDTYIGEGAFYRKIEELEEAGYKIVHTRGRTTKYCLDVPRLTKEELLYLSAMIKGSPDLSAVEAERMITSISSMSVHRQAVPHLDKYSGLLEANNTATNQIKKFGLIVSAIEGGKAISCKCYKINKEGEYLFSDEKILYPKSFYFDGKDCIVTASECKKEVSYLLRELINVELL